MTTAGSENRSLGIRIIITFVLAIGFYVLGPFAVTYMLPTAIVWLKDREHPNIKTIAYINLFLGWTGIVWLAMIAWAAWKWSE